MYYRYPIAELIDHLEKCSDVHHLIDHPLFGVVHDGHVELLDCDIH